MIRIMIAASLLIAAPFAQAQDAQQPRRMLPGSFETNPLKALRDRCRADAQAKGLKPPRRLQVIDACVLKVRPDQARVIACRNAGRAKGLRLDPLRAYVKECRKGG